MMRKRSPTTQRPNGGWRAAGKIQGATGAVYSLDALASSGVHAGTAVEAVLDSGASHHVMPCEVLQALEAKGVASLETVDAKAPRIFTTAGGQSVKNLGLARAVLQSTKGVKMCRQDFGPREWYPGETCRGASVSARSWICRLTRNEERRTARHIPCFGKRREAGVHKRAARLKAVGPTDEKQAEEVSPSFCTEVKAFFKTFPGIDSLNSSRCTKSHFGAVEKIPKGSSRKFVRFGCTVAHFEGPKEEDKDEEGKEGEGMFPLENEVVQDEATPMEEGPVAEPAS